MAKECKKLSLLKWSTLKPGALFRVLIYTKDLVSESAALQVCIGIYRSTPGGFNKALFETARVFQTISNLMIYHVTTEEAWRKDEQSDSYCPGDLAQEGFIHACHLPQLEGVLQRYFNGHSGLLLLHIDESKLTSKVKEELSAGNELFPHIYGKINKDAIVRSEPLRH